MCYDVQWQCCGAENGISDYVISSGRTSHPGVCPLELYGKVSSAAHLSLCLSVCHRFHCLICVKANER